MLISFFMKILVELSFAVHKDMGNPDGRFLTGPGSEGVKQDLIEGELRRLLISFDVPEDTLNSGPGFW